jgi:tryptophan synthase alpha chain
MTCKRIKNVFSQSKAYIAYLTAGDGGVQCTFDAALALIEGGVNILEIGVPFSDPVADGPVIQRAAARALQVGTTLKDILWLIEKIRKHCDIPLILFSYLNPILSAINSSFLQEAKCAGVDGLLIVDCPLEESKLLRKKCLTEKIALIDMLTPSTSIDRIRKIDQRANGFLYYTCRKGTTGICDHLPNDFVKKMKLIKAAAKLPVVVGFGISKNRMVREVLQYADGVVIGSLFVKALEENKSLAQLTMLARNVFFNEVTANDFSA